MKGIFGATGMGKTQNVATRFLWRVKSGDGGLFLDPHEDAIREMKRFLGSEAHRIVEISTVEEHHQLRAGLNPFDIRGLTEVDLDARHQSTVDALNEAFGWTSGYTRGLMLLTMSVRTLLEVARRVPSNCAPTIFQILPLLEDVLWREEVVKHLPEGDLRKFWMSIDDQYNAEQRSVLASPVLRMSQTGVYLHILGQSESTFSFREAMDQRSIVFLKASANGQAGMALISFIVGELMGAFRSRLRQEGAPRNEFVCAFDEVPDYESAIRRLLIEALQQYRKAGARLWLMAQQPGALHESTLRPLLNNASSVDTGRVGDDGGGIMAKRFGRQVDRAVMTTLDRYQFVTQITMANGELSPPFKVRGLQPSDILGPAETNAARLEELDQQIAVNSGMRSLTEVTTSQSSLNSRILKALSRSRQEVNVGAQENANVIPLHPNKTETIVTYD